MRQASRRVIRTILLTIAALYFLIDLIFFSVVLPLRRRIMALSWMRRSREWVGNLNRYAALLLLGRAVADSRAYQTNRLLPLLTQASSRCHAAYRRRRGREAHFVRTAIRYDQTEVDELSLVCMVLQQVASGH